MNLASTPPLEAWKEKLATTLSISYEANGTQYKSFVVKTELEEGGKEPIKYGCLRKENRKKQDPLRNFKE